VLVAEEMLPGLVGEHGVDRLPVRRQVDAPRERVPHAELVGVEDELLVAHRQAALEPACGMQHEIHAAEQRRLHRVRGLVGCLRIGDLRRGQRAARAERYAEPAGE
jgi:hypothetical protein